MCSASNRLPPCAARALRTRWPWPIALALAIALPLIGCTERSASNHIDASLPTASRATTGAGDVLRVCADANNMPFSNDRGEGFENQLAALIAGDLGRKLQYVWWPQRRGFVGHTLDAGACDVVLGVPVQYRRTTNTTPYYRSTYVFVTRHADGVTPASFDDPMLPRLRIGLHTIGDDYANVPPAQALAARGIVRNIRGYPITGDYGEADPPRALLDALARGEIDVAIAWGPLAGWFAKREPVALDVTPLRSAREAIPMTFAIAAGVRRGNVRLRDAVDAALIRNRPQIDRLLARYGVPRLDGPEAAEPRAREPDGRRPDRDARDTRLAAMRIGPRAPLHGGSRG